MAIEILKRKSFWFLYTTSKGVSVKKISQTLTAIALISSANLASAAFSSGAGSAGFSHDGTAFRWDRVLNLVDFAEAVNGEVDSATGVLDVFLNVGDDARFFDFNYVSFVGSAAGQRFWEAGNLQLYVTKLNTSLEGQSVLALEGLGYLRDKTDGSTVQAAWSFSANGSASNSWSSSSELSISSVPEPATLGLLGLGVAGLMVARRKKA